jgi:mRNA interferase MazF
MTNNWIPDRQDIILIQVDGNKDAESFLVLSPKAFNDKTSLVISLPITAAAADNPFAVAVAAGEKNYVLCHQPKTLNWRHLNAKPHPLLKIEQELFQQVCEQLNQIVQL